MKNFDAFSLKNPFFGVLTILTWSNKIPRVRLRAANRHILSADPVFRHGALIYRANGQRRIANVFPPFFHSPEVT